MSIDIHESYRHILTYVFCNLICNVQWLVSAKHSSMYVGLSLKLVTLQPRSMQWLYSAQGLKYGAGSHRVGDRALFKLTPPPHFPPPLHLWRLDPLPTALDLRLWERPGFFLRPLRTLIPRHSAHSVVPHNSTAFIGIPWHCAKFRGPRKNMGLNDN